MKDLHIGNLDYIVDKMVEVVGNSRNEIFRIGEQLHNEHETLKKELEMIRSNVQQTIDEGDHLDMEVSKARKHLAHVSANFKQYSELEVRQAYETASANHAQLIIIRDREKQLRIRRDDVERRLLSQHETIGRANFLLGQVSVVQNYLDKDFKQVNDLVEGVKKKQSLGLQIIEAQEDERRKLAREIHDGPAQLLANVVMRSDLIERTYRDKGLNAMLQEIADFKTMVRSSLQEVRRIIYDLRPMALDDLGLIPTLKKYLQTLEEYNGKAKIDFLLFGREERLHSRFETPLFRLIQESVQNSLKHASAKQITVKVEMKEKHVMATVKDNGIGFDVNMKKEQSFGVIGMKERVDLLGGGFSIQSTIGKGTLITIRIPFEKSE